jgi:hypothetical protein
VGNDKKSETISAAYTYGMCNCLRWAPVGAHWPSCPAFNPADEFGRAVIASPVNSSFAEFVVATWSAETCTCEFCKTARKPRPSEEKERWNWAAEAAAWALSTVGTTITNCTNNMWVVAIDRASEFEPKRNHESVEDYRGRLGKLIKQGRFLRTL